MITFENRKEEATESVSRSVWKSKAHVPACNPAHLLGMNLPKFTEGLSVVSWGFNEEELVGEFVDRMMALLEAQVEDYELIVVDDGSTDETPRILKEASQRYPRLKVITHETNRGIGEALITAMNAAGKRYFVWQTVDWSYDITNFRVYLELLNSFDVVAGVRTGPLQMGNPLTALRAFKDHALSRSDNLSKSIVSLGNYGVVRALFQFPMSDFQNVVFYPTELVKSLNMEARSSFANPELLMKAYWAGASIIEVPISFCPRSRGEAKGTRPASILKSISDILKLWQSWVVQQKLPFKGRNGTIRRLRTDEWRASMV